MEVAVRTLRRRSATAFAVLSALVLFKPGPDYGDDVIASVANPSASMASRNGSATTPSAGPDQPTRVFDIRDFGAVADDDGDDSSAISTALAAARSAGGGVIHIPKGVFVIRPPAERDSLRIGSNSSIRGDGPASVLKVAPGVGSYEALFSSFPASTSPIRNVSVSDLRVDQNCANSAGDVRNGATGHRFAAFLFFDASDVVIERVAFDPICGVNTIDVNGSAVRNVAVRRCSFRFAKGPSSAPEHDYDSTAVYLHGRDLSVTNNVFDAEIADGARGAIELHGRRGSATHNITRGYRSCVRVMGMSTKTDLDVDDNEFSVAENTCLRANDAINVWSATGHSVRGVVISGNAITIASGAHALSAHRGISLTWDAVSNELDGDYSNITIEGNLLSFENEGARRYRGYATSGGVLIQAKGNVSDVRVTGNVIRQAPTLGVRVRAWRSGARASRIRISNNVILAAGSNPTAGEYRTGILADGNLEDVSVTENEIIAPCTTPEGYRPLAVARNPRVTLERNTLGPCSTAGEASKR